MKKIKNLSVIFIFLIIFFLSLWKLDLTQKAKGVSPQGTMTIVASSTLPITVGSSNAITLFSRNDGCTARIITTYASPIMITFATSTDLSSTVKPTGTFGHLQAASTTVSYDSGMYGCGVWQAYGFGASTTISKSEFNSWR